MVPAPALRELTTIGKMMTMVVTMRGLWSALEARAKAGAAGTTEEALRALVEDLKALTVAPPKVREASVVVGDHLVSLGQLQDEHFKRLSSLIQSGKDNCLVSLVVWPMSF